MDFNEIQVLLDEATADHEAGNITASEYKEILEDIQNAIEVEESAEAMELKGKIILGLSIASNLV
jgi:ABC-type lipoprotein release transport system permease subunit